MALNKVLMSATWVQLPPVPGQEALDGCQRPQVGLHKNQHVNLLLLKPRDIALVAVCVCEILVLSGLEKCQVCGFETELNPPI